MRILYSTETLLNEGDEFIFDEGNTAVVLKVTGENEVMAIDTRHLGEDHAAFYCERIEFRDNITFFNTSDKCAMCGKAFTVPAECAMGREMGLCWTCDNADCRHDS